MIWCAKDPNGKLLWKTMSDDKGMVVYNLFDHMTMQFQSDHWKNIQTSRKAYKKLGYKFVKVELKEIK